MSLRGDALAEAEGLEVHVPSLFVGERARVEIHHRSRHHARAHARLIELHTLHPARRHAPCERHRHCSGCPLMELGVEAQRAQKAAMLTALGLPVDAVVGDDREFGYRASSKRVAYEHRGLRLGSWTRGAHDGAWMRGCLVDHPRIAAVFDELEEAARALRVTPFDEQLGAGAMRYAWAKTDGQAVLLTIIESSEGAVDRAILEGLTLPAGVAFATQAAKTNSIRGAAPKVARGITSVRVDGVDVAPLGFLQPNPGVIAMAYTSLVQDERGEALSGARAFDLYAGAGATTQRLQSAFAEVTACESDAALTSSPREVESFLAEGHEAPDLVVANPPRRGLGQAVCGALLELGAPRLSVMSCGPEGLRRDLDRLAARYDLVQLEAFDTLPQTPHVELVAKLVLR